MKTCELLANLVLGARARARVANHAEAAYLRSIERRL